MSQPATHPTSSARLRERPPPRAPWLTPVVIPALLVLQVATVLIYVSLAAAR